MYYYDSLNFNTNKQINRLIFIKTDKLYKEKEFSKNNNLNLIYYFRLFIKYQIVFS